MSKVAAIGSREAVLAFKALGIEAVPVSSGDEAGRALFTLAEQGVAVIFITEDVAVQIPEAIDRYRTSVLPAIIPIPGEMGSTGLGMERVRANVEKAVGADILFTNTDA